jgi:hypothetical protein
MLGKIRQKMIASKPLLTSKDKLSICPLCDRPIPESQKDAHHLIPKSKGGKKTEFLHRICHKQVHALFTETELATKLNHAEVLRAHPEMQKFIAWVKNKPDHFYEKTRKSSRLKTN